MISSWAALLAGSMAGGGARYAVSGAAYRIWGPAFPYGTLAVNLAGCLLLGFLDALAQERFLLGPRSRMMLMVGFCGAFTTFSTLILETSNLLKDGETTRAAVNIVGSIVVGLILLRVGAALAKAV